MRWEKEERRKGDKTQELIQALFVWQTTIEYISGMFLAKRHVKHLFYQNSKRMKNYVQYHTKNYFKTHFP